MAWDEIDCPSLHSCSTVSSMKLVCLQSINRFTLLTQAINVHLLFESSLMNGDPTNKYYQCCKPVFTIPSLRHLSFRSISGC